jgi:hypothetical protein
MSAVAAAEYVPAVVLEPVERVTLTPTQVEAREMNRWMLWFGVPMLAAAVLVGAMFATGRDWLIGPAAALVVADIFVLVWLAMSSDTNRLLGEPPAR